jgi:Fic family protein
MPRTYEAAVVPSIARANPWIESDAMAAADDATTALVRFDSEVGAFTAPFASILLRSESASSSQIENLTAGARAIAEAEIGERVRGNAPLIVRNVRAMQAALDLSDDIGHRTVIAMQHALLADSAPHLTGAYRTEQVWLGGSGLSPLGAGFVPPHHEDVPASMSDLFAFTDRIDLPVLFQTAIAHAQLETIHPFADGNGRTGRALVQAMLRRGGVTQTVTVPVSAGLLADVDRYFAALTAYRAGDVEGIVRTFADASWSAIRSGRALVQELQAVTAVWNDRLAGVRSGSTARRLTSLALEQPVLNAEVVVSRLGVSRPAAYNALDTLVDRGVLRTANSQRRNRLWIADEVIDALDAFAAGVRRR